MSDSSTQALGYLAVLLYLRWSSDDQEQGDSLRRQENLAKAWCKRHGFPWEAVRIFIDRGVSAYTQANLKPGRQLRLILDLTEAGDFPPGRTLLLTENLDRLCRAGNRKTRRILDQLADNGLDVQLLSPAERLLLHDQEDVVNDILNTVQAGRAKDESDTKSSRHREARANKLTQARESNASLNCTLPSWVVEVDGQRLAIPEAAESIRQAFAMRKSGMGWTRMIQELTARGVPPLPGSTKWVRGTLVRVLSDRRVTGRHQPTKRTADAGREADGEALPRYLPEVISPEEFDVVNQVVGKRGRGHTKKHSGIFHKGLIVDALTGGTYAPSTRSDGQRHRRVLLPSDSLEGLGKCRSFSLPAFEGAFLKLLREIPPSVVLPDNAARNEVQVLRDELALADANIETVGRLLKLAPSLTLAQQVAEAEEEKKRLLDRLAEAQARTADRLSATWNEVPNLLTALERAADKTDARLRLRAAVSGLVEKILLLVVPRGKSRFAAMQVFFQSGRHRLYVIYYRAGNQTPQVRTESWWDCWAYGSNDTPELDLRLPEHVAEMRQALEAAPLPQAPTPRA
jgi:DNA invertase Pin-like site-specific DNA recombinase